MLLLLSVRLVENTTRHSFPQELRCFHALPQVGTKASFGEVTTETFILTGRAEETIGLRIQMLQGFQRWWHLCKSGPQTCPLSSSRSWTAHIRNDHAKRRCPSSCLPWYKPHQRTVREAVGKQSDAFQLQTSSWWWRGCHQWVCVVQVCGKDCSTAHSRSRPLSPPEQKQPQTMRWNDHYHSSFRQRAWGYLSCPQVYCVVPTAAVQGMAGEGGAPCHGHLLEFFTSPSVSQKCPQTVFAELSDIH